MNDDDMVELTVTHRMSRQEVERLAARDASALSSDHPYRRKVNAAREWVAANPPRPTPRQTIERLIHEIQWRVVDRPATEVVTAPPVPDLQRVLDDLPPDGMVAVHMPVRKAQDYVRYAGGGPLADACWEALRRAGLDPNGGAS